MAFNLARIKMIAMDVDGVLTDGRIILGENIEVKCYHVQDGYAIKNLPKYGIIPVIITGRISKSVEIRSKELGIKEVYQGVSDKLSCLKNIMEKYNLGWEEICYVGDDIPDLEIMKSVGLKVAVNNAVNEVKGKADIITLKEGGNGAIRELIDIILEGTK